MQLERYWSGVSGQVKIDREDVKRLLVPVLPESTQEDIEEQYLEMVHNYHSVAIDAKIKMLKAQKLDNAEAAQRYQREYDRNLEIAEAMLGDLAHQVEEIIRTKRTEIESVNRILNTEQDSGT